MVRFGYNQCLMLEFNGILLSITQQDDQSRIITRQNVSSARAGTYFFNFNVF